MFLFHTGFLGRKPLKANHFFLNDSMPHGMAVNPVQHFKKINRSNFMKTTFLSCAVLAASAALYTSAWADSTGASPAIREVRPAVDLFEFRPGEGVHLEFLAPGGNFDVEVSDDLGGWAPLSTVTAVNGRGIFTDTEALGLSRRFYRVAGSFSESDYHLLDPVFSIEHGLPGESLQPAGFRFLLSEDNVTLQSANNDEGLFIFDGESWDVEGIYRPTDTPRLRSLVERAESGTGDSGTHSFQYAPGGLTLLAPEEEHAVPFTTLEGDRDFLLGRAVSSFQEESREGVEISMPFMARKSIDATPELVAGDWGFVLLRTEMEEGGNDGVGYQGIVFTGEVGTDGRLSFAPAQVTDVHQPLQDGLNIELGSGAIGDGNLTISPDGKVDFLPDLSEQSDFTGFTSPSGNFMTLAATEPASVLPDGVESVEDDAPDTVRIAYALGVKRDFAPDLAGNNYRVFRSGFWIEPDRFEINISPEDEAETLAFSQDGETASRMAFFESYWTSFDGAPEQELGNFGEIDYTSVSIDGQGMIHLEGRLPDDSNVAFLFGFSHDDGRVLVLFDGFGGEEEGADIGMIVAVRQDELATD